MSADDTIYSVLSLDNVHSILAALSPAERVDWLAYAGDDVTEQAVDAVLLIIFFYAAELPHLLSNAYRALRARAPRPAGRVFSDADRRQRVDADLDPPPSLRGSTTTNSGPAARPDHDLPPDISTPLSQLSPTEGSTRFISEQLRDMQQQQRDMEARMEAPIEAGSIRPGLY